MSIIILASMPSDSELPVIQNWYLIEYRPSRCGPDTEKMVSLVCLANRARVTAYPETEPWRVETNVSWYELGRKATVSAQFPYTRLYVPVELKSCRAVF